MIYILPVAYDIRAFCRLNETWRYRIEVLATNRRLADSLSEHSPTLWKMFSSALRASSSALQHTFEQHFCRCGSPLLAQPAATRVGPSSRSIGRRTLAGSARWRQELQQHQPTFASSSSSVTSVRPPLAGIPPVPVAAVAQVQSPTSSAAKAASSASTSKPARREIKAAKAAIHLVRLSVQKSSKFGLRKRC